MNLKHFLTATKLLLAMLLGGWACYYFWKTGFDLEALIGKAEATRPEFFLIAMSALPLIGFPISAFYVFAGIAFAWPLALGLALSAIMVNLVLSYVVTHTLLKTPLQTILTKTGYNLPQIPPHHQTKAILIVRLMPVAPFFVQNYLLALGGASFWTFLWLSLLLQGLIGSAIILLGQSFMNGKSQIMILGVAILLLLIFFWIKKRFTK